MQTGIKVRDAMTKKPVFINPNFTVLQSVKKMLKDKVGSLVVKYDHKLIGIITEKDIVKKAVSKELDPSKVLVSEIMTKKVVTISPERDLYEAMVKMNKNKVRRMPVMDNNKFLGLLTMNDILRFQPDLFELILDRIGYEKPEEGEVHNLGYCEKCGSYGPIYKENKKSLCGACRY